jgi:hypothetical protein
MAIYLRPVGQGQMACNSITLSPNEGHSLNFHDPPCAGTITPVSGCLDSAIRYSPYIKNFVYKNNYGIRPFGQDAFLMFLKLN